MLSVFVALCILSHHPKSFADLEQAKLEAVSRLSNLQYSAVLSNMGLGIDEHVTLGSFPKQVEYKSFDIHGNKSGSGSTGGSLSCILTPQDRFAFAQGGKLTHFPGGTEVINPQVLAIYFTAGQQVAFSSCPGFALEGISSVQEQGELLRKAISTAHFKRGIVKLTQWFLPDKWIVKRFSLEIVGEAESFSCGGNISNLNLQ